MKKLEKIIESEKYAANPEFQNLLSSFLLAKENLQQSRADLKSWISENHKKTAEAKVKKAGKKEKTDTEKPEKMPPPSAEKPAKKIAAPKKVAEKPAVPVEKPAAAKAAKPRTAPEKLN